MIQARGPRIVLSYSRRAREAAEAAFAKGGNAFDAAIVATLIEYVEAPGFTSLAGAVTAIYRDASGRLGWLDGSYDAPPPGGGPGAAVCVPGAPAALHRLHERQGRLLWKELCLPAEVLAREGFELDDAYNYGIDFRPHVLRGSEHGRATFFDQDGQALSAGTRLRQPTLADTLRQLAEEGPAFMYRGAWARSAVSAVRAHGGALSEDDFARYEARVLPPRIVSFGEYELACPSGRSYGGLYAPLMLKLAGVRPVPGEPHFSGAPAFFAELLCFDRRVKGLLNELGAAELDDEATIAALFTEESLAALRASAAGPASGPGSHSCHDIAADEEGNVVSLTNTINSLPWGSGLFVGGAALNESALHVKGLRGTRLPNAFGSHLILRRGSVEGACGAFNMSLMQANSQFLLNTLRYGMLPAQAVSAPRFGANEYDLLTGAWKLDRIYLQEGFSPEAEAAGNAAGFTFAKGMIDAGDGGLALRCADGWDGALSPTFAESSIGELLNRPASVTPRTFFVN